ncbi:glycosyl hydrolase family 18 [Colletotrichum higginsianum]|nr:glycosyl hydrolase family 18 [Colletotrichum higginsianum]
MCVWLGQVGCGSPGNGGCDYLLFCASGYCARVVQVPCLEAMMNIYAGGASGIDITITVKEDGIETCKGKSNCSFWGLRQCNKEQTVARGGSNSMMVHFNLINYERRSTTRNTRFM